MALERIVTIGNADEGRTIWRYLPRDSFIRAIERGILYMPTAQAYCESDPNEGRFTEAYVSVLRRAAQLDRNLDPSLYIDEVDLDEEVGLITNELRAVRNHAYISCWSLHEDENEMMWSAFARDGVAIRTTVGLVLDQLYNWVDYEGGKSALFRGPEVDRYELHHGEISYNRNNSHLYLNGNNYREALVPFFCLDGSTMGGFSHEAEYRFILIDQDGAVSESDDHIGDKATSTYISPGMVSPRNPKEAGGLELRVNFNTLILELRVSPFVGEYERDLFEEMLEKNRIWHAAKESKLGSKAFTPCD